MVMITFCSAGIHYGLSACDTKCLAGHSFGISEGMYVDFVISTEPGYAKII